MAAKTKSLPFEFGTATVPEGRQGPWAIETFTATEEQVKLHNLRCDIQGRRLERMAAGTYKRLAHDQRGVVMSNTPMEVRTNRQAYRDARGSVLVNGLGLGMLLEGLLSKPEVTAVRVIEVDADVIALVGPHFAHDPRVTIVHADAYAYRPATGERFDYVWHDIWDDIQPANLPKMTHLARRYGQRTRAQGFWSKDLIQAYQR